MTTPIVWLSLLVTTSATLGAAPAATKTAAPPPDSRTRAAIVIDVLVKTTPTLIKNRPTDPHLAILIDSRKSITETAQIKTQVLKVGSISAASPHSTFTLSLDAARDDALLDLIRSGVPLRHVGWAHSGPPSQCMVDRMRRRIAAQRAVPSGDYSERPRPTEKENWLTNRSQSVATRDNLRPQEPARKALRPAKR